MIEAKLKGEIAALKAELEQAAERQRELIECIIHHQSCRYCAENGCSSCGDCTANAILAQAEVKK